MSKAKIHIEGGTGRVEAIRTYLDLIDRRSYDSAEAVMEDAFREFGLDVSQSTPKEMKATLEKLGIVEPDDRQLLTGLGRALVDVLLYDEQLFFEMFHFVYATAYHRDPSDDSAISWSYYQITDEFRRRSPVKFTDAKQEIVEAVMDRADRPDGPEFEDRGSLSGKSMNNYRKFIEKLDPEVITDGTFELRSFAQKELVLVAIDHMYRTDEFATTDYGGLLELSGDVSDALCTICLLDEDNLTDAVEHAASMDSRLKLTSDYSLRVRLTEPVEINDLA
jgi:hypothetical protein